MAIVRVKIGYRPTDYIHIASLAANVIAGLTANAIDFPAPNPSLATLSADLASLNNAITVWGPVHNRGSHADYTVLQAALMLMYNDLITEAAYVQSLVDFTQPYATQAAFIALSGFSVKNLPTPQGLLAPPQNLHQYSSNAIDVHTPLIRWSRPLGINSPNNVKSYEVYRSPVNVQPATSLVTVTATRFLDTDAAILGTTQYYWIAAVNDMGAGAPTASLKVDIPSL